MAAPRFSPRVLAARRAQAQCRKGPEANKAMGEMKKASPEMSKLKARSVRALTSPNEPGIDDILARRQQAARFTKRNAAVRGH